MQVAEIWSVRLAAESTGAKAVCAARSLRNHLSEQRRALVHSEALETVETAMTEPLCAITQCITKDSHRGGVHL